MENKHQHSATTAPHHHNHLHSHNSRGQEIQGAVVADSSNSNNSINNNSSKPGGQLESITISASYWDENKYSAFDLLRQQSQGQGEQGLGWSQDIVRK